MKRALWVVLAVLVVVLLFVGVRLKSRSPEFDIAGICIRTPFGPGQIRFQGCTAQDLSGLAVIPETGNQLTSPPQNDTWYDADGFWRRGHQPANEWFKVGDHCDVTVVCMSNGDLHFDACCNGAACIFVGFPHWSQIDPGEGRRNPF